jgi:hypothetical protein
MQLKESNLNTFLPADNHLQYSIDVYCQGIVVANPATKSPLWVNGVGYQLKYISYLLKFQICQCKLRHGQNNISAY